MAYLGPDEEAPMKIGNAYATVGGSVGFAQSFKDRLRQLHRERHDLMNRMMKVEQDIATIERILGN